MIERQRHSAFTWLGQQTPSLDSTPSKIRWRPRLLNSSFLHDVATTLRFLRPSKTTPQAIKKIPIQSLPPAFRRERLRRIPRPARHSACPPAPPSQHHRFSKPESSRPTMPRSPIPKDEEQLSLGPQGKWINRFAGIKYEPDNS